MTTLQFEDDGYRSENAYYRALTIADLETFKGLFTDQKVLNAIYRSYESIADQNTAYAVEADGRWLNIAQARVAGRHAPEYKYVADEIYRRAEATLSSWLPILGSEMHAASCRVVEEFLGQGPLTPLLTGDGDLADVRVAGPNNIFVEESGSWKVIEGARFTNDKHLDRVVAFIAGGILRERFDETHWVVDAQLPTGDRVHMVHAIVDGSHTMVVRRFPRDTWTMHKLLSFGSINEEAALFLSDCVRARFSIGAVGGTGSGKRQALDTPILTANRGWSTAGELEVGDFVFGPDGEPTRIRYVSPVGRGKTYRVTFCDGASVVVDAEHLWFTEMRQDAPALGKGACPEPTRWVPGVRTTQEIHDTLDGAAQPPRHRIPATEPLHYPYANALADPFRVGFMAAREIQCEPGIPETYLRSGIEQRQELLAGVAAAAEAPDGGEVVVRLKNRDVARQIQHVALTLGFVATVETVSCSGHGGGDEYVVSYSENKTCRSVVSCEEVDPVDMLCIAVSNESHLYLVGEHLIPTHNTSLLNSLTGCITDEAESISVIEDSRELRPHPRLRNIISHRVVTGVNSARDLLKSALREAPRRIIIGEIRDGIMADFTQAANTGHEGSMTTFHANSSKEAFARMRTLYAMGETAGMDSEAIAQNLGLAFDVLATVRRVTLADGRKVRRVAEIVAIDYDIEKNSLSQYPIYVYDNQKDALVRVGDLPPDLHTRWEDAFALGSHTTLEDLAADQAEAEKRDAEAARAEAAQDAWSSNESEEGEE